MLLAFGAAFADEANPPSERWALASQCSPRAAAIVRPAASSAWTSMPVASGSLTHVFCAKFSGNPPSLHSLLTRKPTAVFGAPPPRLSARIASDWLNALLKSPKLDWSE